MATSNTTLAAAIAAAMGSNPTKINWSGTVGSSMGNSRRVRCLRDPNANAANPAATGVEFLNMASTGPLTVTAGNITGFGTLSNITKRLAADLSTGSCVLVLEGNGYAITYTLGLPGSGKDFILPASPTGSSSEGYAFTPGAGTKAPRLLASGTGPAAPNLKTTTPTIVELVDWTDPANPVVVGIATYSAVNRQDDWVFENPDMASEIGDVAIYQMDSTIKWTTPAAHQRFELGGLLLVAANYNTDGGTIQLEQMLLSFKPYGRWAGYPAMANYVEALYTQTGTDSANNPTYTCTNPDAADLTFPPPFKINLYTAAGYANGAPSRTPSFTHEMKAFNDIPTLPINSPQLINELTYDHPLIPPFNCGMMLPWQNARTRASSKAGKYFNGVKPYAYGPTMARSGPSSNACIPLINAYPQINSLNHWYAMPLYPMKLTNTTGHLDDGTAYPYAQRDIAYLNAYDTGPDDPNMFGKPRREYNPQAFRWTGTKYQPASISGHDWRTGNGGQRFDRSASPTVLAIWASNQNYVKPQGNVPIRDLTDDWGLAYFNHSNHWITNALTFASIPKRESLNGDWTFRSAYYGTGGPYGSLGQSKGPDKTIDLKCPGSGNGVQYYQRDALGRLVWGGWQRDNLHSYCNAAWWAIMLNSPMHAIIAKHDFDTQWMSGLGDATKATDDPSWFMVRSNAWRYLAYTLQWQVASQHPLSVSQSEVESRFFTELEHLYDTQTKPAFVDNSQDPFFVCLRNFGHSSEQKGNSYYSKGGSLMLYMAHTLVVMRQTGLWSVMKQKSAKCRAALEMFITLLDKATVDYTLDTGMRDFYYPHLGPVGAIPANWAAQSAWLDTVEPATPGAGDPTNATFWQGWAVNSAGHFDEQYGCPHLLLQYLQARKDFFPEYVNPRLDAALAKVRGLYQSHDAAVSAGNASPWNYLYPSHGELNAPTTLGPN